MMLKKLILVAFLLPVMVVLSHAADAPEVDYNAPVDNYYAGVSLNLFSGDHTQDDEDDWSAEFDDQPIWNSDAGSFGFSFGRYFGSTAEYRHAIEVGYLPYLKTEYYMKGYGTNLVNNYKNIFTLDYLHLRTLNDNVEFFGTLGIGSMELGGGQFRPNRVDEDRAFENEVFMTFGGGLLYELNDNYDLKLTLKKYTNTETDRKLVLDTWNNRYFGFEDAYVTSASLLYNF